jgi:hypothetical protein
MHHHGDYAPDDWQGAARTASETKEKLKAFDALGCDELVLFMTAPSANQVDRLAEGSF